MDQSQSGSAGSRRVIAGGVAASYLQAAVSVIVTLIGTPIYLSLLGSEQYGLWLAASSWTAYLAMFRGGVPQAAGNQMAKAWARSDAVRFKAVLRTSVLLTSAAALAALALGFVAGTLRLIPETLFETSDAAAGLGVSILLATGFGYLVSMPLEQYSAALRAAQQVHREQVVASLVRILGLGVGLAMLVMGMGVVVFATAQALMMGIAGAICAPIVRRALSRQPRAGPAVDRAILRSLVGPSFHFLLLSLSGALIWSTDNIVISSYLSAAAVTPYAVSFRLFTLTLSWLALGIRALTPTVTSLDAAEDRVRLDRVMLQVPKLGCAAIALACIGFGFFGREFVRFWAGEEAVVSSLVMWTFVATLATVGFTLSFEVVLIATSRHARYAYVSLAEGLINLILSIVLVGHLGLWGVALGTLAAHLLGSGWYVPRAVTRQLGISWRRIRREVLFPLVVPTAAAVAVALPMQEFARAGIPQWLVASSVTAVTFLLVYGILGLNQWERDIARNAAAQIRARVLRAWAR